MDWPLTGAIAGVVVLAGAVTAGTVFALRTTPEPSEEAANIRFAAGATR
jgi:hypothetical protein